MLRALGLADDALRRWLPRVAGFDDGVLILEAAPGAQDLGRCQPPGRYSRTLARECGRALAALHELPEDVIAAGGGFNPFKLLRVHDLDLAELRTLSVGGLEVVRLVQNADGLCARTGRAGRRTARPRP